jgi:hypothetical protein
MQKGASLFEREAVIRLACRDTCDSLPKITNEASLSGLRVEVMEDVKSAAAPQVVLLLYR